MIVSIIIPVYRVEKYLSRCIDSVINQSYENIEIILVDDGSPDNCGYICDEYAKRDSRVKVIHKENEGVCVARNLGINVSTGDYIFFVDSDDYISKEAISVLLKHVKQIDADITIGNYNIFNQNNEVKQVNTFDEISLEKELLNSPQERYKYFFGNSFGIQVWNRLYKSSFIKKNNVMFEKQVYYGEDFLFNMKLFIRNPKICLVDSTTYFYYQNSESITNSYKENLAEQYLYLLNSFYNYVKENNKLDENQDLIAYSAFTFIDTCALNTYIYSNKKFSEMKMEIEKFKYSDIINKAIKDLSKGKYLKSVPRKDWKYFAWIFSFLFRYNFLNMATLLLLLRFNLKRKG